MRHGISAAALISEVDRDGGMMLFAVDGKTNEFAVFDCRCTGHARRALSGDWIVGTNHCGGAGGMSVPEEQSTASQLRFECMGELLDRLWECGRVVEAPWDLVRVLADPGVEVRGKDYGTVYANVACPSRSAIWYPFGGYPAASAGACRPIQWPWEGEGDRMIPVAAPSQTIPDQAQATHRFALDIIQLGGSVMALPVNHHSI